MTPEQMKRMLENAGINVGGGWGTTQEKEAKSPIVERQKEHLSKLAGLLEQQIEEDKKRVALAQEALVKLKHGGGASNGR